MDVGRAQSTRVLVADDTAQVLVRLAALMEEVPGVQLVGCARDGAEAWAMFQAHRPHGAIVDFQMPLATGLEVLLEIRKIDRQCLVVILTGIEEEELRQKCLAAGADHFLSKSTEFETVVEIFKRLVARREAEAN